MSTDTRIWFDGKVGVGVVQHLWLVVDWLVEQGMLEDGPLAKLLRGGSDGPRAAEVERELLGYFVKATKWPASAEQLLAVVLCRLWSDPVISLNPYSRRKKGHSAGESAEGSNDQADESDFDTSGPPALSLLYKLTMHVLPKDQA